MDSLREIWLISQQPRKGEPSHLGKASLNLLLHAKSLKNVSTNLPRHRFPASTPNSRIGDSKKQPERRKNKPCNNDRYARLASPHHLSTLNPLPDRTRWFAVCLSVRMDAFEGDVDNPPFMQAKRSLIQSRSHARKWTFAPCREEGRSMGGGSIKGPHVLGYFLPVIQSSNPRSNRYRKQTPQFIFEKYIPRFHHPRCLPVPATVAPVTAMDAAAPTAT